MAANDHNNVPTQESIPESLRALPSVTDLLGDPLLFELLQATQHDIAINTIRTVLQEHRSRIQEGTLVSSSREDICREASNRIRELTSLSLRPVVNGTGVVLHTNLGRAPLANEDLNNLTTIAESYSNLELDLHSGTRGSRQTHVIPAITALTYAENALVLNNNAAALLLAITATSKNREVIVSRGEQIEIGGGFRIPDILRESGAEIVEVGSTNRTRIDDFRQAITRQTSALLRVHPSNFKMTGFTEAPDLKDIIELGREFELPVLVDLGSGCLIDTSQYGLSKEPTPADIIKAGADLVFFSGDKLLGGPQSGIIVGKNHYIEQLANHPLARALRIDKLSLAALEMTLLHYVRSDFANKIPIWRMISASLDDLLARADSYITDLQAWWNHMASEVVYREDGTLSATMYSFLDGVPFEDPHKGNLMSVEQGLSTIGGGSLPGETLATYLLVFKPRTRDGLTIGTPKVQSLADFLRNGTPSVMSRIEDDKVILDLRTVLEEQDSMTQQAIKTALRKWLAVK